MTEPEAVAGGGSTRETIGRLLRGLSLALVVAFLLLAGQRMCSPPEWAFSIEARTQVVELQLREQAETRWRVDGALVCSRQPLALDPSFLAPDAAGCGGRAWHGHALSVPEPVLVLEGHARATFQRLDAKTLAVSIQDLDGGRLGRISVAGAPEVAIGSPTNLLWSADAHEGGVGERIFPFSAETTIGRDIHWSGTGVLLEGRVTVFTVSESAEQRRAVDEAQLMLGDQVRLGAPEEPEAGALPKGFVRAVFAGDDGGVAPLEVVAFGRADRVRIDRFGDSGYELAPSFATRLLNDPILVMGGTLLLAFLGLGSNVQPLLSGEGRPSRIWKWLRSLRSRRREG